MEFKNSGFLREKRKIMSIDINLFLFLIVMEMIVEYKVNILVLVLEMRKKCYLYVRYLGIFMYWRWYGKLMCDFLYWELFRI